MSLPDLERLGELGGVFAVLVSFAYLTRRSGQTFSAVQGMTVQSSSRMVCCKPR